MGKKKTNVSSRRVNSATEIFVLDASHERMVTGQVDYRMLVILLVVVVLLFAIPLFLLHDDFPRGRDRSEEAELISDAGFSGVSITFGLFIFSIQLFPDLRLWRMRRNGQIIWATTLHMSGQRVEWTGQNRRGKKINGIAYDVTVLCQFKNPHGRIIRTHATYPRKDLRGQQLPQNAVVAVLYVSDQEFTVL